jgi:DNA-binding MltR family transcriptional regulator
MNEMNLRTQPSTVLLGAAIADQQLQDALLTKMPKLSRDLKDELFTGYGPLSSLGAKIALAYALDLLDATAYKRIKVAQKIRNKFAHSDELFITFDSPEIASMLAKFPQDCDEAKTSELLYLWHLNQVELHLVQTAGPHILKSSTKIVK